VGIETFAVLHSEFEQVLFLDVDSYPCRNPEFLFDDPQMKEHGAMFFPDAPWMKLLPEVWQAMGMEFIDERAIESGQFLIDKKKCWQPLALTYWMNQRSDYYFQIGPRKSGQVGPHFGRGVHGDKDLFHLAWRYLKRNYVMPNQDYTWISPALVQHAPDGDPVFIHRARRKFSLADTDFGTSKQEGPQYEPKLPMEDVAQGIVKELRGQLS
jgi:alpha 1,2-mannosyltransferase